MRKQLLMALLMFLPMMVSAEEVEIDGLWYNLVTKAKEAKVIQYKNNQKYSGDIVIPSVVTYQDVDYVVSAIDSNTFIYCNALTSVSIPYSITDIGFQAFSQCSALTSITIPNSVLTIGNYSFSNCTGLNCIIIENGVNNIGDNAFRNCTSLTTINLPNTVTVISDWTFYGCSSLTSITIPSSITYIGSGAFYGCRGLTSITIPNNVTFISNGAFSDCSKLSTIIIGSSVTDISSTAFANCENLTDVYCYAEIVPITEDNAFDNSYIEFATLHVPSASVQSYMTTTPWNSFKYIVPFDAETPVDGKCATPTISYQNGKVRFVCETDDVEFVPTLTVSPKYLKKNNELEIGCTFTISVYAKKDNYENSDTVAMTINMSEMGDVNADGQVTIADVTSLVNVVLGK